MINCILDFDPGVDDAAALFAIKNSKNLKLLALSSVNGNVSIEHTTRNMQCLAKLLDINVPMGKGQEVPLVREPFFATVHGNDGIAGFRDMIESEDVNELTSENSVTMMHEIIQNSSENHETWHAIMERHQHAVVNFFPIWGRFGYMLLTNQSFSQQA